MTTTEVADMLDGLRPITGFVDERSAVEAIKAKVWSMPRRDKLVRIVELRLALTGSSTGPGVWDTMLAIGLDETIKRLREAAC